MVRPLPDLALSGRASSQNGCQTGREDLSTPSCRFHPSVARFGASVRPTDAANTQGKTPSPEEAEIARYFARLRRGDN